MTRTTHADRDFAKYAEHGAYHWREIGRGLLSHNAFTAERYRTVADRAGAAAGERVLDYGCGEGALLGVIARRAGTAVDLHGFEPNALGLELARGALRSRGVSATLHASTDT